MTPDAKTTEPERAALRNGFFHSGAFALLAALGLVFLFTPFIEDLVSKAARMLSPSSGKFRAKPPETSAVPLASKPDKESAL